MASKITIVIWRLQWLRVYVYIWQDYFNVYVMFIPGT